MMEELYSCIAFCFARSTRSSSKGRGQSQSNRWVLRRFEQLFHFENSEFESTKNKSSQMPRSGG